MCVDRFLLMHKSFEKMISLLQLLQVQQPFYLFCLFISGEMFVRPTTVAASACAITTWYVAIIFRFQYFLFANNIPSEGTTLDKGPSGLGKEIRKT